LLFYCNFLQNYNCCSFYWRVISHFFLPSFQISLVAIVCYLFVNDIFKITKFAVSLSSIFLANFSAYHSKHLKSIKSKTFLMTSFNIVNNNKRYKLCQPFFATMSHLWNAQQVNVMPFGFKSVSTL